MELCTKAKDDWKRFFLLMSAVIALMERRPPCPGCPTVKNELRTELRHYADTLKVEEVLRGWSKALRILPTKTAGAGPSVFLLSLDAVEEQIEVTVFPNAEQARASDAYLETEKMIRNKPSANAVLVSVESLQALRSAFPNYFADTRVFISAVNHGLLGQFPA